ncbi:MAG: hypothetical protein F4Y05_02705 [Acidimicrobiaceae bacterium]|nr:hypothetical protein [Acidimicrobiaceae bacterium]
MDRDRRALPCGQAPASRAGRERTVNGYYRPGSVREAVAFLAGNPEAVVIAGGTDLVIDRRLGRADPQAPLVDVTVID